MLCRHGQRAVLAAHRGSPQPGVQPERRRSVARRAASQLATHPAEEIVAAQQVLWDLMADSYTNPLWAAAYVINYAAPDPPPPASRAVP
ncbi:DUF4240 domain-containing protein [Streptomyces sp. NPDC002888]|uniref:DUF4240 domain-containing protein n=1 Tax=Streptomyces sp. NPDC002888 TaxID=3364668 RepID=UPI00367965AF